jgi:hypothetical protein
VRRHLLGSASATRPMISLDRWPPPPLPTGRRPRPPLHGCLPAWKPPTLRRQPLKTHILASAPTPPSFGAPCSLVMQLRGICHSRLRCRHHRCWWSSLRRCYPTSSHQRSTFTTASYTLAATTPSPRSCGDGGGRGGRRRLRRHRQRASTPPPATAGVPWPVFSDPWSGAQGAPRCGRLRPQGGPHPQALPMAMFAATTAPFALSLTPPTQPSQPPPWPGGGIKALWHRPLAPSRTPLRR